MKSLTLTFLTTGRYQCPGLGLARDLMLESALQQTGCQDCPVFHSCKMSHWTEMQTEITDLEALRAACAELGLAVLDDVHARGFAGQRRLARYVIKCPGRYDIAVDRDEATGHLKLNTDWWGGDVEKVVGKDYGKLLQLYGVHKATAAAQAKRYRVTRQTNAATGAIHLTIHV
jgi:hypothetical protein